MLTEQNIWALAEGYVAGSLAAADLSALKNKLAEDAQFAAEFNESVNMIRSLQDAGSQVRFKAITALWKKIYSTTSTLIKAIVLSLTGTSRRRT